MRSVLSIDIDDDVQVLSTQGSGSANGAFETFNKTLAQQIQKVVLGQTLISQSDGTSGYALGKVHVEMSVATSLSQTFDWLPRHFKPSWMRYVC